MADLYIQHPNPISDEDAHARSWGYDCKTAHNDHQLYCSSNGGKGARVKKADKIKFPQDLKTTYWVGADLRKADLADRALDFVNMEAADLRKANLKNSDMRFINLKEGKLQGANLTGAALWGADLTDANFTGATLDYDALFQTKEWEKVDFTDTLLVRDGEPLNPDESRVIFKARMEELGITNARGLEEKIPNKRKKIVAGTLTGIIAGVALVSSFMDEAEPQLPELLPTDKEVSSVAARIMPSIEEASAKAGFAPPEIS